MINCGSVSLCCLPVQLWEAQKIKQVSDPPHHKSAQVNSTSKHSGLQASDSMRMMLSAHRPSFILTQERRSSCHFECQVRPQMKIFAKVVEVSPSFVGLFCFCFFFFTLRNHVSACAGYVPFGTPIVSLTWKSYILIMHFIEVKPAVQTSIYIVMCGERWNETLDLFCLKISSYSLVSFRSLAFFSQIRQWCLPLYGRYSNPIVKPLHLLYIFNIW